MGAWIDNLNSCNNHICCLCLITNLDFVVQAILKKYACFQFLTALVKIMVKDTAISMVACCVVKGNISARTSLGRWENGRPSQRNRRLCSLFLNFFPKTTCLVRNITICAKMIYIRANLRYRSEGRDSRLIENLTAIETLYLTAIKTMFMRWTWHYNVRADMFPFTTQQSTMPIAVSFTIIFTNAVRNWKQAYFFRMAWTTKFKFVMKHKPQSWYFW